MGNGAQRGYNAPPLVITKPQMDDCLGIIADVLRRNASKDE